MQNKPVDATARGSVVRATSTPPRITFDVSQRRMKDNLTATEIQDKIKNAESELFEPDGRADRLWERIKVPASLWAQSQYPTDSRFWVIAIMGTQCMYFNYVEGGWGWGRYQEWGRIETYHWQQDEIQHVVFQMLAAIDREEIG